MNKNDFKNLLGGPDFHKCTLKSILVHQETIKQCLYNRIISSLSRVVSLQSFPDCDLLAWRNHLPTWNVLFVQFYISIVETRAEEKGTECRELMITYFIRLYSQTESNLCDQNSAQSLKGFKCNVYKQNHPEIYEWKAISKIYVKIVGSGRRRTKHEKHGSTFN